MATDPDEVHPDLRTVPPLDTDPALVDALVALGRRWGPLGVALAAAYLTDPDVLTARLATRYDPYPGAPTPQG